MTHVPPALELSDLRETIDRIDNDICALLRERMQVVHDVGVRKQDAGLAGSFIRSGREARMIRALSDNLNGAFPPAFVARIWRAIIASSLAAEHDFVIHALARPSETFWFAREYFAGMAPVKEYVQAEDVVQATDADASSVGILPAGDHLPAWWLRPESERNNLYVFACVPFVDDGLSGLPDMFAFADITPEETGEDATLIALDARGKGANAADTRTAAHKALPDVLAVHAACDGGALVSVSGYLPDIPLTLHSSSLFREARVIGRYALPIIQCP